MTLPQVSRLESLFPGLRSRVRVAKKLLDPCWGLVGLRIPPPPRAPRRPLGGGVALRKGLRLALGRGGFSPPEAENRNEPGPQRHFPVPGPTGHSGTLYGAGPFCKPGAGPAGTCKLSADPLTEKSHWGRQRGPLPARAAHPWLRGGGACAPSELRGLVYCVVDECERCVARSRAASPNVFLTLDLARSRAAAARPPFSLGPVSSSSAVCPLRTQR